MTKLTRDQARIRQAFNNFPFGGLANIHFIEAEHTPDEMFAAIANTLESLSAVIEHHGDEYQRKEVALADLERDIQGMRRVLGIGADNGKR